MSKNTPKESNIAENTPKASEYNEGLYKYMMEDNPFDGELGGINGTQVFEKALTYKVHKDLTTAAKWMMNNASFTVNAAKKVVKPSYNHNYNKTRENIMGQPNQGSKGIGM